MLLFTTITGNSALREGPTELPPSLSRRLPTDKSPARLVQLNQARETLARVRRHEEMQKSIAQRQKVELFFQSLGLGSQPKTQNTVASTVSSGEAMIEDLTRAFSALSLGASQAYEKK